MREVLQTEHRPKISPTFRMRLARLSPSEKVRAIIFLDRDSGEQGASARQSRARKRAMETVRRDAKAVLPEIDNILERFGGKRLQKNVNVLGSVLVETTPEGINALAASDHIKAVLEDQAISPLSKLSRA